MNNIYKMDASQRRHDLDLTKFYTAQTGMGISTYGGYRYMKGSGFFGRFLKTHILPLVSQIMPYVSDAAGTAFQSFAGGIADGKSLKEAGKKTLKRTAASVLDNISGKLRQDGSGIVGRATPRKRAKLPNRTVTSTKTKKKKKKKARRTTSVRKRTTATSKGSQGLKKKARKRKPISSEHKRRLLGFLEKANKVRQANLLNKKSSKPRSIGSLFEDE